MNQQYINKLESKKKFKDIIDNNPEFLFKFSILFNISKKTLILYLKDKKQNIYVKKAIFNFFKMSTEKQQELLNEPLNSLLNPYFDYKLQRKKEMERFKNFNILNSGVGLNNYGLVSLHLSILKKDEEIIKKEFEDDLKKEWITLIIKESPPKFERF